MRYCPPIYVLCVSSHLWTVPRQIKFWAILIKSWDWRDPPSLGQNPKFTQKKVWRAPLRSPWCPNSETEISDSLVDSVILCLQTGRLFVASGLVWCVLTNCWSQSTIPRSWLRSVLQCQLELPAPCRANPIPCKMATFKTYESAKQCDARKA